MTDTPEKSRPLAATSVQSRTPQLLRENSKNVFVRSACMHIMSNSLSSSALLQNFWDTRTGFSLPAPGLATPELQILNSRSLFSSQSMCLMCLMCITGPATCGDSAGQGAFTLQTICKALFTLLELTGLLGAGAKSRRHHLHN